MKVTLKTITPQIEENIVEIARVSSSRENKTESPSKLINYLIKNNHWSPFEHGFLTFEIETSRGIAAQLLRHRSNYFQEFSQRYQDVNQLNQGEGIFEKIELRQQALDNRQSSTEVFDPYLGHENEKASEIIQKHLENSESLYNALIQHGVAKECARFVLPLATKTRLYITMNIRSVIHWLDLRDDSHAQKEVQDIALEVKKIVVENLPLISLARGYTKLSTGL